MDHLCCFRPWAQCWEDNWVGGTQDPCIQRTHSWVGVTDKETDFNFLKVCIHITPKTYWKEYRNSPSYSWYHLSSSHLPAKQKPILVFCISLKRFLMHIEVNPNTDSSFPPFNTDSNIWYTLFCVLLLLILSWGFLHIIQIAVYFSIG